MTNNTNELITRTYELFLDDNWTMGDVLRAYDFTSIARMMSGFSREGGAYAITGTIDAHDRLDADLNANL